MFYVSIAAATLLLHSLASTTPAPNQDSLGKGGSWPSRPPGTNKKRTRVETIPRRFFTRQVTEEDAAQVRQITQEFSSPVLARQVPGISINESSGWELTGPPMVRQRHDYVVDGYVPKLVSNEEDWTLLPLPYLSSPELGSLLRVQVTEEDVQPSYDVVPSERITIPSVAAFPEQEEPPANPKTD